MSVMASEITNLLEMLDTFDRGTGPWNNVAEQIIERVRNLNDTGDLDAAGAGDGSLVIPGVSNETKQAFENAVEEAATYGMEILAPILGYEDEREEVVSVANEALQAWRAEKDGAPLPAIEVEEEDDAPNEGPAAA